MIASSTQSRRYSTAYAIFEGGGAKGIAHVGALKALDDQKLALAGVAGASAGAIIAALVAVGYTPAEIFTDKDNNILRSIGLNSPIEMLGRSAWRRLRYIRQRIVAGIGVTLIGLLAACLIWFVLADAYLSMPVADFLLIASVFMIVLGTGRIFHAIWPLLTKWGILDSAILREAVNTALKRKLAVHYQQLGKKDPVPDIVLFEHIDPARIRRCIPLKIVATNVTTGELVLFDKRYPQIPVADVVAASAALPFVFRPATIPSFTQVPNAIFADGGLVSNLPAWAFRDERKALERDEAAKGVSGAVPTYAFSLNQAGSRARARIVSAAGKTRVAGSMRYAMDVLTTGIFGGQGIVQEFIPGLSVIKLNPGLSTLSFDCTAEQVRTAIDTAHRQATEHLERQKTKALLEASALDAILASLTQMIRDRRGASPPRLRLALIDPVCRSSENDVVGFEVVGGANMADDADDALELDVQGEIAPAAFRTDKAVYGKVRGFGFSRLRMTKYEYALLPRSLCSVIAVPVYARPDEPNVPQRVLALDSDDDLIEEFDDPAFRQAMLTAGATVSRTLIEDLIGKPSYACT